MQLAEAVRFVLTRSLVCNRPFQSLALRKHARVGLLSSVQRSASRRLIWSTRACATSLSSALQGEVVDVGTREAKCGRHATRAAWTPPVALKFWRRLPI